MSFSYNKDLILEHNERIESLISTIQESEILSLMRDVIKRSITKEDLFIEFRQSNSLSEVTGEHIKNYFAIVLNGVQKVWNVMTATIQSLHPFRTEGFYENIYTYLDELLDKCSFEDLFQDELKWLNGMTTHS